MDAERLRSVARNLFESAKANDHRTLGEKAIGLLAFQQLGGRCDIITRPQGSAATLTLRLTRGSASAQLDVNERRRAREHAGTTVNLGDLDPDVLRMLTQRKVADYLRRRRGAALARGDHVIEIVENKRRVLVTAEEPEGVRLDIPSQISPWGRIEFALYVASQPDKHRRVAVVGRAGTTIIDDLSELEEFEGEPWSGDQVSGRISFESLQQTAGRRAVVRDRDAFPAFVDAVGRVEPAVLRTLERVSQEVTEATADRLADAVRKIFGRVLKELSDLDNPMRTPTGDLPGEGGLLSAAPGSSEPDRTPEPDFPLPPADEGLSPEPPEREPPEPDPEAGPSGSRYRGLPNLVPDPEPDGLRSRFDHDVGIVYYNDRHTDHLLVKDDQRSLLDYLATLVAKEYVLYNNPRAQSEEVAEEMVRMLVRVRRHLPRKP